MGILSDIAKGKWDFVNGDVENLSDSRNWPIPKNEAVHSKFTKEEKETTNMEDIVVSISSDDGE